MVGLATTEPQRTFKLASYNVQVGIDTNQFRDYVTKGWKHVLPHKQRILNLNGIANMLSMFDMVSLQEVDAGSLRSGFVDMTEYLAYRAGFPYWYHQVNRNIGPLARHSNGFLSRYEPSLVVHHKLPGGPGRGAMLFEFGRDENALALCNVHLALGKRSRGKQLDFVGELIQGRKNLVLMGDLNTCSDAEDLGQFLEKYDLQEPSGNEATYPSWRPTRKIDHILVSRNLKVVSSRVVDFPLSDHLPICVELQLPESLTQPV